MLKHLYLSLVPLEARNDCLSNRKPSKPQRVFKAAQALISCTSFELGDHAFLIFNGIQCHFRIHSRILMTWLWFSSPGTHVYSNAAWQPGSCLETIQFLLKSVQGLESTWSTSLKLAGWKCSSPLQAEAWALLLGENFRLLQFGRGSLLLDNITLAQAANRRSIQHSPRHWSIRPSLAEIHGTPPTFTVRYVPRDCNVVAHNLASSVKLSYPCSPAKFACINSSPRDAVCVLLMNKSFRFKKNTKSVYFKMPWQHTDTIHTILDPRVWSNLQKNYQKLQL